MKSKKTTTLIIENILLLIPLIIYGIYKNGYLVYRKGLINGVMIFKPLFLVIISILIKFIIDFIKYKKIKIDYNLVISIIVAMIMPCNINIFIYIILFASIYLLSDILEKHLKFNKVCFIYLVIILVNFIIEDFTFQNLAELNYSYSFSFLDLLFGRNVGGISSTSIILSLISYVILVTSIYYKKDIPLIINLTYLILGFSFFLITKDNQLLLNSEMIFGSVFVAALPISSPFKEKNVIIYSIFIGIFTFLISWLFNSVIAIYLSIFIVSLFSNLNIRKILTKGVKKKQNKTK